MKKILLAIFALICPVALLCAGSIVMDNLFVSVFSVVVAAVMLFYTARQFQNIGKKSNFDTADAFWLSACVSAGICFIYLSVITISGWKLMDGFANRVFAFGPVGISFAYCCLLVAVICVLRLWLNKQMTPTGRVETFSFLLLALAFIGYTLMELGTRYCGLVIPKSAEYILELIFGISLLGIVVCGYRTVILHKSR